MTEKLQGVTIGHHVADLRTQDAPLTPGELVQAPVLKNLPPADRIVAPRHSLDGDAGPESMGLSEPAASGAAARARGLMEAGYERARRALVDASLSELEADLGVANLKLEVIAAPQLTVAQRAHLAANPGQAFVHVTLELSPNLLPSVELGEVQLNARGALELSLTYPIDMVRPEETTRAADALTNVRNRLASVVGAGVSRLDATTLAGKNWEPGSQIELSGSFTGGLALSPEDASIATDRRSRLRIRVERRSDGLANVAVLTERTDSLRGSAGNSNLSLSGRNTETLGVDRIYVLDPSNEKHRAAFAALVSMEGIRPRLSTEAIDVLGGGHVIVSFRDESELRPRGRVPVTHVSLSGEVRRIAIERGSITVPRTLNGRQLSSAEARSQGEKILTAGASALPNVEPGTSIRTVQESRFDWAAGLSASSTDSILAGYLNLGIRGELNREQRTRGLVERTVSWRSGDDGAPQAVLSYRAIDREALLREAKASVGLTVGPELSRLIEKTGTETLNLDRLSTLLDDYLSPSIDFADKWLDSNDRAYNKIEREINDALDQLTISLSIRDEASSFDETRLLTRPLNLENLQDRVFYLRAMGETPLDEVIVEGAAADIFDEHRETVGSREVRERAFQSILLNLALKETNWEQTQRLIFRQTDGSLIEIRAVDAGETVERDGIVENLNFRVRLLNAYDVTNGVSRMSSLTATADFDDRILSGSEAQALSGVAEVLSLGGSVPSPASNRLFGHGNANGAVGVQISQQGLFQAILRGPSLAQSFRTVTAALTNTAMLPTALPNHGPRPARFDLATLDLVRRSNGQKAFEAVFPELDYNYTRALYDTSSRNIMSFHLPWQDPTVSENRITEAMEGAKLDPEDTALRTQVALDLRVARAGRLIQSYQPFVHNHQSLSLEEQSERASLERHYSGLTGRSLAEDAANEARALALFRVTQQPSFTAARASLVVDSDQELTLELVDKLVGEGFRAVTNLGRPGSTSFSNDDFYALALWTTLARAAGSANRQVSLNLTANSGFSLDAGTREARDPSLEEFVNQLRDQIRAEHQGDDAE